MARLVRAATDRNPPTLGGGGCQRSGMLYIKVTVVDDVLVVSFKEL